jgi:nucleoside-diphosphate kinase
VSDVERTFVMVKPDGVQRGLVGEVVSRIEERGLKLAAIKTVDVDRELAETHYEEHRDKPFFEGLVDYVTSDPVVAMVVEGPNAIQAVRGLAGETDPIDAHPGTIRGDFGLDVGRNVVHGSDAPDTAQQEIKLWFGEDEILDYDRIDEGWIAE